MLGLALGLSPSTVCRGAAPLPAIWLSHSSLLAEESSHRRQHHILCPFASLMWLESQWGGSALQPWECFLLLSLGLSAGQEAGARK